MNKRTIVNEIFVIRAAACLSVVLMHSLTSAMKHVDKSNIFVTDLLSTFVLLLMFATPTFIFLSEFLLSISYPDKLPNGFFVKRIKFLLIPYISIGVIYAAVSLENFTFKSWIVKSIFNVFLTDYYGYFIIIIFQFYILHWLFAKQLKKASPKKMILFSFSINFLYLLFFNVVTPSDGGHFINAIWNKISYMPFIAWIFYFTLGYYAGRNYKKFVSKLQINKSKVFTFAMFSVLLLLLIQYLGIFEKTWSKRPDVLIYTTGILLLIFYFSSKIKVIPSIVYTISNYSFNIYLLHMIIIVCIEKTKLDLNIAFYIPMVFVVTLTFSILTAYLFNKLPFGHFIVGNTQKFKRNI